MDREQEIINQQLNQDLSDLHFTRHAEVLNKTHPRTWNERMRGLWNKELELPLVPLGTVCVFFFVIIVLYHEAQQPRGAHQTITPPQQRELYRTGGNIYWKDEYERRVAGHENQDQS